MPQLLQSSFTFTFLFSYSVLLASHYPEKVGHVDVIADAKDIKKLLVLPYRYVDIHSHTILIPEPFPKYSDCSI